MRNFWDGFEKRSHTKEALFPGAHTLTVGLLSHLIPNVAMLKGLRSKRVAQHIGDQFSAGLFNTPISRTKSFLQGATAGVAPEIPLLQGQARHMGNQLREHLASRIGQFAGEHSISALSEALKGNIAQAYKYDPEVTHAVLEFAKQNKANPLLAAINVKSVIKHEDHPILTNIIPNLIRLPQRRKGSVAKAVTEGEEGFRDYLKKAPSADELENMQWNLKKKPPAEAPKAPADESIKWTKGKDGFGEPAPYPKTPGKQLSEEELDTMAQQYTSPMKTKIKQMMKGPEMESYLPDLKQWAGPAAPAHKGWRALGAAAGSAATGAIDPAMGATNFGKYLYFATPKVRQWARKKLKGTIRGKELGVSHFEDALTTSRLGGALHRGLVEGKRLNPFTNWFHRYIGSGIQGEAARTINALGVATGKAIPPEHRKNVFEHVVGAVKGVPGSLQAKSPAPPLMEQLKPFALPAAGVAGTAGAAYALGKNQRKEKAQGRPQVAPGGNVMPFVRPPAAAAPPMPEPDYMAQYGGMG